MTTSQPAAPSASQDTLSLQQLIGAMPIAKIWAVVLAVFIAAAGVAGAGFALGQRTAEVSVQEKVNAVSAQLAKAQAETVVQTERAAQAAEKLKLYIDYAANLNGQVAERDRQILGLNERLGRANTCTFLQEQISALQQQIGNIASGKRIRGSGIYVSSANTEEQQRRDAEQRARDDSEIAQLQQRVLAFTGQLSACAR